ncbi:MAG: glycosyltransferase family 39 protein [Deltaproteobacteria bacterium]|nr:glycosyltransferase family 39 protein [Deltaproteobacteria bacterium]
MNAPPIARADRWLAVALAVAATVLVAVTAQQLGFTRDEGYYFKAGEQYWRWFESLARHPVEALSAGGIDRGWGYNHEHPALVKTLFAWSFGVAEALGLSGKDGVLHVHDALRFPAWCFAGLSVALTFLLARTLLSRRAALVAALLWLSLPHPFWHMHVACFDVAISAAHTWLVLAYLRWRHTPSGALAVGALFGLAAAVKHNVLVVPALLVLHWLITEAEPVRREPAGWRVPRIPLVFPSLALVGPLVFLLTWPWLWHDPFLRVGQYLGFHLRHEHYPILYFGKLWTHPPFPIEFPFVMSAVTIPTAALVLMVLGVLLALVVVVHGARARWARTPTSSGGAELTRVPLGDGASGSSCDTALLVLLNAFLPFVLIALPWTPIFGGTKHWMNGLPFLCVLAAWALEEACARLRAIEVRGARGAFALLALLVIVPGFWISARVWPYGLGSYNELIGFTRGAANVGMQRTFWGYEPRAALPIVNERAPRNGRIHFGDTNHDSWRMYQRDGLLRADIAWSGTVRGAAVASVQPQGEFKQQWLDVWNEWGDRSPDVVLHTDGVPVATVTVHAGEAP